MPSYFVRDVAKRYGVSQHTILYLIKTGQLKALNVARNAHGGKPRWRIPDAALAAFETARTPAPPAPRKQRRRLPETIEFYK